MKTIMLLILCIGLTSTMVVPDWESFKGSPEKMGSSDQAAPDTLYLLWEVNLGSELYSSPVVKNGKVFQVAFEELFCIDLANGDVLWKSPVPAYYSTPAVSEDKVIVATNSGIAAYAIDEGDLLWEYQMSVLFSQYPIEDYIVSSPVISDGRVVVGGRPLSYWIIDVLLIDRRNELFVFCVDETTGKKKWYVETTLGVRTSPCVSHGRVFVASREISCIDLKRGKVLWNSEDKYPHDFEKPVNERYAFDDSTPALYHGIVIGGSNAVKFTGTKPQYTGWQKIVFIDQYTGDILWEWAKEGILASSPAMYKGKIYFYSHDGMVRCVSFFGSNDLWNTPISQPGEYEPSGHRWSSPTLTDYKVFIGSIEGTFYCLDSDTGEILWKYETGGSIYSSPAAVQDRILISSTDGNVYCFGIDPETYKMKAEKYIENKEYEKAEEFLLKAKDYAETDEEMEEIDQLRGIVESEMPEYQKRLNKLSEAESLIDEADNILWNKKYKKAKDLYTKACEIYKELEDEFGVSFCEKRIECINGKIEQQSWIEIYWWIVILLICVGIVFSFILKRFYR